MRIEINLLPWRQSRRNVRKKALLIILFVGLATLITSFLLIHYYLQRLSNFHMQRNQFLRSKIAIVSKRLQNIEKIKIQKNRLIKRIVLLQKIQNNGSLTIHFFDEISNLIPEGVYLNRIQRVGNNIMLQGVAEFNEKITILMRKIEQNSWLKNPNLLEIKMDKDSNRNQFNLKFLLADNKELFR